MTLKKQTGIRIVGICAVAKQLGCSHTPLRRIIDGQRPMTAALAARARRLNAKLPKIESG